MSAARIQPNYCGGQPPRQHRRCRVDQEGRFQSVTSRLSPPRCWTRARCRRGFQCRSASMWRRASPPAQRLMRRDIRCAIFTPLPCGSTGAGHEKTRPEPGVEVRDRGSGLIRRTAQRRERQRGASRHPVGAARRGLLHARSKGERLARPSEGPPALRRAATATARCPSTRTPFCQRSCRLCHPTNHWRPS